MTQYLIETALAVGCIALLYTIANDIRSILNKL